MLNIKQIFIIVLAIPVGLLAGCNLDSQGTTEQAIVHTHEMGPSGQYALKPHAPVDISYKVAEKLEVNQPATIYLSVTPSVDVDNLVVRFTALRGKLTLGPSDEIVLGPRAKQQTSELELEVTPEQGGMLYVNVSATLTTGDKQQARNIAVPLAVGDTPGASKVIPQGMQMETDAKGRRILTMPAKSPED